jgi:hypothetical protein
MVLEFCSKSIAFGLLNLFVNSISYVINKLYLFVSLSLLK